MLDFQKEPDKLFIEALNASFEIAIDEIKECDDEKEFAFSYPYASRNFSRKIAVDILEKLIVCNEDGNLWELTDYHYLLIFDVLRSFCSFKNDLARADKEPILIIDGKKVWELDFNHLVDTYFFDTDFLISQKAILSPKIKDQMGINQEDFGLAIGLKAHPEELELVQSFEERA